LSFVASYPAPAEVDVSYGVTGSVFSIFFVKKIYLDKATRQISETFVAIFRFFFFKKIYLDKATRQIGQTFVAIFRFFLFKKIYLDKATRQIGQTFVAIFRFFLLKKKYTSIKRHAKSVRLLLPFFGFFC